uniref:Uncharacterized protein n=1 Tax=Arundo donax TaxID=35708 RepID=A0A0A9E180_ARUDO
MFCLFMSHLSISLYRSGPINEQNPSMNKLNKMVYHL